MICYLASTILIAHILWMVWLLHILTTLQWPDYRGGPDILPFWSPLLLKLLFLFLVLLCRVWNIWNQQSSAFCSCDQLEAHDRIARRCRARKNRCHSWYLCFWSLIWSALEFGHTNCRGGSWKEKGSVLPAGKDVGLGKASGALATVIFGVGSARPCTRIFFSSSLLFSLNLKN